ncbi:DUF2975 domain-containing protein [Bacteroides sp.]
MKRRLNILCLLVMIVISYSLIESLYYFSVGFNAGVEMSQTPEGIKQAMTMKPIAVAPSSFSQFPDSVYNEKTHTYVPALYGQLVVSVPVQTSTAKMLMNSFVQMFAIAMSVVAVIMFIQLIVSINRSRIFEWRNVRRLRWLGGALILHYLCMLIPLLMAGREVNEVFALRGYTLHQSDLASILTLVLGIVSLIVAEVFSIGLKMKEEQDLTI